MRIWQKNISNGQEKKYKLVIPEKKLQKNFASLKEKFSEKVWTRMLHLFTTKPKGGKKEMQFRKYNLPDGCRVIYYILENGEASITRVVCAGDHNTYTTFLRKYGKKRK